MSDLDDEALFIKVKEDNLRAFETIFHRYYADVMRFASSIVRDKVIGEEIAQEVFMYIWEKRQKINLHTGLKSYLLSSAKNKAINYLKLELPKQQSFADLSELSDTPQPELVTGESELLKLRIQRAIDSLPKKCRNIFTLSRYGGLTYQEIAEDLDISIKTVENQMSIALKKLKETLKEELKNFRIK